MSLLVYGCLCAVVREILLMLAHAGVRCESTPRVFGGCTNTIIIIIIIIIINDTFTRQ